MSLDLRHVLKTGNQGYVQSPIDDLQSFFWVALWAVLHSPKSTTEDEKRLCGYLSQEYSVRQMAHVDLKMLFLRGQLEEKLGPVFRAMVLALLEWYRHLETLQDAFISKFSRVSDPRRRCLLFDCFAYQGVARFVEVLSKHRVALLAARTV